MDKPLNLTRLAREYSDETAARAKFEEMRWGKDCHDVTCPHCGIVGLEDCYRVKVGPGSSTRPGLWRCRACKGQFTVTKGTVFEDSHVPLTKWLLALYLLASSKKGMSAHQIHRMLGVKYQTAWFMMHRLRYAMGAGPLADKLRGVVEMDETFIGGKRKGNKGRLPSDKRKGMIIALVERDGRARAFPMPRIDMHNATEMIKKHVDPNVLSIQTDEAIHYGKPVFGKIKHETVAHKYGEWVRGSAHTNTVEGFFSLLKRGIVGTFHHIGTEHLEKYANEFAFRYSHRNINDGERAEQIFKHGEGKRLTYKQPAAS